MIEQLERLRALGADTAAPSDDAVDAARTALSQLILESGEQPAQPNSRTPQTHPAPRPRTSSRTRPHTSPPKRRTRSRWPLRAGIVAALAAVGVVIAGLAGSPTASSPPSAAAAALEHLAKIAAGQAWTGLPKPGQFQYTKSQSLTETDTMGNNRECAVTLNQNREIWIATNGAGAIRETNNQGRFTSAQDRTTCAAFHITNPASQDSRGADHFGPGGLSLPTTDWHKLSTDPHKLLLQLRTLDGGPRTSAEDFVHIGDFLRESDAPPAIRAALYRAAALIPNVQLQGPTKDHIGRSGLGVAYMWHGHPRAELIFDQRTAKLLAEDYFNSNGTVADWTVYLDSKIVNKLPKSISRLPAQTSGKPTSTGTSN